MADGQEDLKEKNKDNADVAKSRFTVWRNFQGREDAEMLQEKSDGWSAVKDSRGDYSSYDED